MRDNLELLCLGVEIHLKITPVQLPALKRHLFNKPLDLIRVRIEIQPLISKIIYSERIAVLTCSLFRPDTGNSTDSFREYVRKGLLLRLLHDSKMDIPFHVTDTTRKLQAAVTVIRGHDITGTAKRIQPGKERNRIILHTGKPEQPLSVPQRYGSAVFTTAQIDSGSLDPPFGIEILGYFRKGIETKYLIILYVYISGGHHLADNPIFRPLDTVYIVTYQLQVFGSRGIIGKGKLIVTVHHLEDFGLFKLTLYTVELAAVGILNGGFLLRLVILQQREAFTLKIHVIIHAQFHVLVKGKRQIQDIVIHHFLYVAVGV